MNPTQDRSEGRRYLSYLLRLWRVEYGPSATWRGSLECPHTGEQEGFADLEALVSYLRKEMEQEGGECP